MTGNANISLYSRTYKVNPYIEIRIPLVGEIYNEDSDVEGEYFGSVMLWVATPYDMMVQLDDMHINFTKIDDWDLFCLLFREIQQRDMSLLFNDLCLKDFELAVNNKTKEIIFINRKTGAVIDRGIHNDIASFFRQLFGIEKNTKRPANEEGRRYIIEKERKRIKRLMKQKAESQFEKYIVALVCAPEFPYDFESVKQLSVYQFYKCLAQVTRRVRFNNLMIGCYAGTVNMKEINRDELSWI